MHRISTFFILVFTIPMIITGCASQSIPAATHDSYDSIAQELVEMRDDDQRLEMLVVNKDPQAKEPGFFERKDQAQAQNAIRCKEIFAKIGYPSEPLVGQDASRAFWLLVQHADADPTFQEQVAIAMKPVVLQGHAQPNDLAMLTDRVRINTNRLQVFGSQVTYDMDICKAMPKPTENPQEVDQRRTQVGLIPLWQYMNDMSELHFMVNQQNYQALDVQGPYIYPEGFSDW